MAKIFISHNHKDKPEARRLRSGLKQLGHEAIVDDDVIVPGEDWKISLGQAYQSADFMVFLFTNNSISPGGVLNEFQEAERLGKRIIPVVADDIPIPMIIGSIVAVVAPANDIGGVAQEIDRAVKTATGGGNKTMAIDKETDAKGTSKWWVPVLVALIGIIPVIIVGYWQYGKEKGPGNEQRKISGRVTDAVTGKSIQGAKVMLEAEGVPDVLYTDSEGVFSFTVKGSGNEGRIRVEAAGYEMFDRRIPLSARAGEEIRLTPKRASLLSGRASTILTWFAPSPTLCVLREAYDNETNLS